MYALVCTKKKKDTVPGALADTYIRNVHGKNKKYSMQLKSAGLFPSALIHIWCKRGLTRVGREVNQDTNGNGPSSHFLHGKLLQEVSVFSVVPCPFKAQSTVYFFLCYWNVTQVRKGTAGGLWCGMEKMQTRWISLHCSSSEGSVHVWRGHTTNNCFLCALMENLSNV